MPAISKHGTSGAFGAHGGALQVRTSMPRKAMSKDYIYIRVTDCRLRNETTYRTDIWTEDMSGVETVASSSVALLRWITTMRNGKFQAFL